VAVRVELLDRDVLLEADPRAFFVTDHYLAYPWVLVRLTEVHHAVAVELLEQAWRRASPKRLVAEHIAAQSAGTRKAKVAEWQTDSQTRRNARRRPTRG
jgi:hypothetical protein